MASVVKFPSILGERKYESHNVLTSITDKKKIIASASSISVQESIQDIDMVDRDNPQAVAEYVKEIYAYLLEQEMKFAPPPGYLATAQTEITSKMRSVLVDWISEVHTRLKLANESFFHAVTIIDRFLAKKKIAKSQLQLVGIACLLIASKFEESYTPCVKTFLYMSGQTYRRRELLEMEKVVLNTLKFQLSNPTSITFLRRYARIAGMSNRDRYLSFYLAELSQIEYKLLSFAPSMVAASCVLLSHKLARMEKPWSHTLRHYSGYSESDLSECVKLIENTIRKYNSCKLNAMRQKYGKERYYKVSSSIDHM
ncbi:Cyclin like protein [Aduncisulcus paluster]|uniref:Cyclin like protein n=1 Tax=Aduncisulcus paluster TaxID=2918883 RepID=A0ABQ5KV81_9EUKA|nr:Cyclin like protein [Aduncisulcus paluster]